MTSYPWCPAYLGDRCPACFENFDLSFKCDNCGNGHDLLAQAKAIQKREDDDTARVAEAFDRDLLALVEAAHTLHDAMDGATDAFEAEQKALSKALEKFDLVAPPPKDLTAEARRVAIVAMAFDQYTEEGQVEIDDNATLSEGDNGTYVQAWVWVDFAGTAFDKEPTPC
jgi:hypothetical protein